MTQNHHLSCCVTLNYCVDACIRLLGEVMTISGTAHGASHPNVWVRFWRSSLAARDLRIRETVFYFRDPESILSSLQQVSCNLTHYCGSYGHLSLCLGALADCMDFCCMSFGFFGWSDSCGHAELTEPNRS